jgi:hypothetical protein
MRLNSCIKAPKGAFIDCIHQNDFLKYEDALINLYQLITKSYD